MKKCVRCFVTYEDDSRTHCIYCDSGLMYASAVDALFTKEKKIFKAKVQREGGSDSSERVEYLMGSYFRSRSFLFSYLFHRQEYKIGNKFRRFLIEPLRMTSFLKIPWVLVDLVDTLFFRMLYGGYCPVCQCKIRMFLRENLHPKTECDYNKEYTQVIQQIRNGEIAKNEFGFRISGAEKKKKGLKSAYYDLCEKRNPFERITDVLTILFSITIIIAGIASLAMPYINDYYGF